MGSSSSSLVMSGFLAVNVNVDVRSTDRSRGHRTAIPNSSRRIPGAENPPTARRRIPPRSRSKIRRQLPCLADVLSELTETANETKAECPICLEAYDTTVETSCGHRFCAGCIKRWLQTSQTCAICRDDLYDRDKSRPRNSPTRIQLVDVEDEVQMRALIREAIRSSDDTSVLGWAMDDMDDW